MQYRPPNANLDNSHQTMYIVTGDNGCRHLLVIAYWPTLLAIQLVRLRVSLLTVGILNIIIMLVTQSRYAYKCIVTIMN